MNLSREEASQALGEIDVAGRRSRALRFYAGAAPYFILWGVIWLAADLAMQVWPEMTWIWPVASTGGGFASLVLGILQGRGTRKQTFNPVVLRALLTYLTIAAFIAAVFILMSPVNGRQVHAFYGVLSGVVYMLVGIWVGLRGFLIGLGLFLLSVGGFLFVREYFALFMGIVGGGGMILCGLWLRKV